MKIFKEIENARKILGIGEKATINEIKQAYNELSLKYHPDRCKEKDKKKCEKMMKKINMAVDILLKYCFNYKISFRKQDVEKNLFNYEEYLLESFFDDWWGDVKK